MNDTLLYMTPNVRHAVEKVMDELFTHFEREQCIVEDPSLFLAYDSLAVILGDESDIDGVEQAKALLSEGGRYYADHD